MSLEKQIETLNTNIEKLVSIFEAYPNPIDEANEKKDSAVSRAKAKTDAKKEKPADSVVTQSQEEADDAVEPEHSLDELAALAKKVLQADKATNQPKVKQKMKALGISKVSATPDEHIDEMYAFLEGLE
ncbi:hypothetical protein K6L05_00090 [Salinicoccus roseus]|uniref:hypothetical protein n=1 Tax=Salinicoccus roseus TaxID=45670 RepID=UPI001CA6CD17|nr:hypothetical protein [Salinicoccus roseus]MBY8908184.1 hypothetical protein [Salinicoccus roseus]